jgi:hypothetical protein
LNRFEVAGQSGAKLCIICQSQRVVVAVGIDAQVGQAANSGARNLVGGEA